MKNIINMKNPGNLICLTVLFLSALQVNAQTTVFSLADSENKMVPSEFEPVIANWEDIIPMPAPGPGIWQYFTTGGSSEIIANPFTDEDNPTPQVLAWYRPEGEWLLTGFYYQDGITITKNMTGIEFKIYGNHLVKCYAVVNGIVNGVADQKIEENAWPWTAPSGANVWNTITLPVNADLHPDDTVTTLLIFVNPQLPEAAADTFYIDEVRFLMAAGIDSVVLNYHEINISAGENIYLEAYVYPENASNKNISWVSLNTDVVKVSSIGKVSALGPGTAAVVVISEDGNYSDTCWFYVESPGNIADRTAEMLQIRPNPYYGGNLEISVPGDPSLVTKVTIYNLLGDKVFSVRTSASEDMLVIQPRLTNGMYLVAVEYNRRIIYGKLIRK